MTMFAATSPMSPPRSGRPSPKRAVFGTDLLCATLEHDLGEERSERQKQVEFFTKAHSRERAILIERAEGLEQRLCEARELWERERSILLERLAGFEENVRSHRTTAVAATAERGLREEVRLEAECRHVEARAEHWKERASRLEFELSVGRNEVVDACSRVEKAELTSRELASSLGETEMMSRNHREAFQLVDAHAREEAHLQLTERSSESRRLHAEIRQLEVSNQQLQQLNDGRLQQLRCDADARVRRCEAEYLEPLRAAMLQLQVSDQSVQGLRQEASLVGAEHRQQYAALERLAADESVAGVALPQRFLQLKKRWMRVVVRRRLRGNLSVISLVSSRTRFRLRR
jgi:hypothetical protein